MVDLFESGNTLLKNTMKSHLSQTVTYVRGSNSVAISATYGEKRYEVEDADNFRVWTTSFDFTFLKADLILDGSNVEPVRHDLIRITVGATTAEYQVLPLGNDPCWRFSDQYSTVFRVHTKFKRSF